MASSQPDDPLPGSPDTISDVHGTEDVVISGISCRLPESDNMTEFRDHLMNGDDMVTEDNWRWPPGE